MEELKKGKVQAVRFYAKGANGRSFYNTKVGIKHPHIKRDSLREISETCHENGIKIMFYYSCCVDDYIARVHPDWSMNDGKQDLVWNSCDCGLVCFNSPYTDEVVLPQLEELTVDIHKFRLCFYFLEDNEIKREILGSFKSRSTRSSTLV